MHKQLEYSIYDNILMMYLVHSLNEFIVSHNYVIFFPKFYSFGFYSTL